MLFSSLAAASGSPGFGVESMVDSAPLRRVFSKDDVVGMTSSLLSKISSDFTLEAFEKSRYLNHISWLFHLTGFEDLRSRDFQGQPPRLLQMFQQPRFDPIPYGKIMGIFFGSHQPGVPRNSMDLKAMI